MMKRSRSFEDAVEICVDWWAEKAFHTPMNQNFGDETAGGGLVFLQMNISAMEAQRTITPNQEQVFKEKLFVLLLTTGKRKLQVDYQPDKLLKEACDVAEISSVCMPCKSMTYITEDNYVNTQFGFGSEITQI